jgi:hypothetical protein
MALFPSRTISLSHLLVLKRLWVGLALKSNSHPRKFLVESSERLLMCFLMFMAEMEIKWIFEKQRLA